MTLTITEADRHPGMYAISDSALLPVEEQVFFSGYFGKHGPWVYVAGPQLLEALEWMVENDETNEGDEPIAERGGRSWNEINSYWIDGLNRARAAIALAKGPKT
jgi:hypothetical protein